MRALRGSAVPGCSKASLETGGPSLPERFMEPRRSGAIRVGGRHEEPQQRVDQDAGTHQRHGDEPDAPEQGVCVGVLGQPTAYAAQHLVGGAAPEVTVRKLCCGGRRRRLPGRLVRSGLFAGGRVMGGGRIRERCGCHGTKAFASGPLWTWVKAPSTRPSDRGGTSLRGPPPEAVAGRAGPRLVEGGQADAAALWTRLANEGGSVAVATALGHRPCVGERAGPSRSLPSRRTTAG